MCYNRGMTNEQEVQQYLAAGLTPPNMCAKFRNPDEGEKRCLEQRLPYSHLCREHNKRYQRKRYEQRVKPIKEAEAKRTATLIKEAQEEFDRQNDARLLKKYGPPPSA